MDKDTKGLLIGGSALTLLLVGLGMGGKKDPTLDDLTKSKLLEKSKQKIMLLHPLIRERAAQFINLAAKAGIPLLVVSTLRSYKEQGDLYDQGRTKPGKVVTNSKPGYSFHNFGLAFDIAGVKGNKLDYNLDWKKLQSIADSLGLVWGGTFKSFPDKPHYEYHPKGKTLADLRTLYNAGKRTGEYVNLT